MTQTSPVSPRRSPMRYRRWERDWTGLDFASRTVAIIVTPRRLLRGFVQQTTDVGATAHVDNASGRRRSVEGAADLGQLLSAEPPDPPKELKVEVRPRYVRHPWRASHGEHEPASDRPQRAHEGPWVDDEHRIGGGEPFWR